MRSPAETVPAVIAHLLDLAETWTGWDGEPIPIDDRVYTPHKAVRRQTDHVIDHLAEIEARLAGEEPRPDEWHASNITTAADLAPFTAADLDEARSRLTRLADVWRQRIGSLTEAELDAPRGEGWTIRQIAEHLDTNYYADAVGRLK